MKIEKFLYLQQSHFIQYISKAIFKKKARVFEITFLTALIVKCANTTNLQNLTNYSNFVL